MESEEVGVQASQQPLFPIPLWEFNVSDVFESTRAALTEQALAAVDSAPVTSHPFRQSLANLHEISPLWADAVQIMTEIAEQILSQHFSVPEGMEPIKVRSTRCWALRVDSAEQWDEQSRRLSVIHNHPGSTLSSVLYLDVPEQEGDDPTGGTLFVNPLAHVADPRLVPRRIVVPAKPLHMIMFPSWVEHGPARPSESLVAGTRLTVAADYLTFP